MDLLTLQDLIEKEKKKGSVIMPDPSGGIEFFNSHGLGPIPGTAASMSEDLHPVPSNYEIERLSTFNKEFKKLKFTDADFEELVFELKTRPPKTDIGSSVFKFEWWPKRFTLGNQEGRVIYIEYVQGERIYLYSIYHKKSKKDVTPKENVSIRKLAKLLRGGK